MSSNQFLGTKYGKKKMDKKILDLSNMNINKNDSSLI